MECSGLPGVIVAESPAGEWRYLLSDGLRSIRQATDESGNVVAYHEFERTEFRCRMTVIRTVTLASGGTLTWNSTTWGPGGTCWRQGHF